MAKTLLQFLTEEQRKSGLDTDLIQVIGDVANACKTIASAVNRAAFTGSSGYLESENVQGETQKKLDVITDEIFIGSQNWTGRVVGMASEEMDDVIPVPQDVAGKGKYLLCFDPLDGSSNVDVNISVGTIFSVLNAPAGVTTVTAKDFMQKGVTQVAAGYAVYGSSTMLVLTTGNGVNGFTLDTNIGDFVLTHPDMTIPAETKEFAINASNMRFWEAPVKRYIDECLAGKEGPRGRDFNMRWVASMVAEIHRILNRGGIFMYPLDSKLKDKGGKLRLMYEANPMSFIVEQAGGASSTGRERILEIQPNGLHQRVPVIMGSKNEVEVVVSYHKGA